MRAHLEAFVHSAAEAFELTGPVYEFGPCSPEPLSNAALGDAFPQQGYLGCDLGDGAEIQTLDELTQIPFPAASARTVVSIDALERVLEPRRAVLEMIRILAPGGLILLASSTHSPASEPPGCYWHPTAQGFQRLLSDVEAVLIGWLGPDESPHTLLGIGCKPPRPDSLLGAIPRFLDGFRARLDAMARPASWTQRVRQMLLHMTRTKDRRRLDRDYYKAHFVVHLSLDQCLTHQLLVSGPPPTKAGGRLDVSG